MNGQIIFLRNLRIYVNFCQQSMIFFKKKLLIVYDYDSLDRFGFEVGISIQPVPITFNGRLYCLPLIPRSTILVLITFSFFFFLESSLIFWALNKSTNTKSDLGMMHISTKI